MEELLGNMPQHVGQLHKMFSALSLLPQSMKTKDRCINFNLAIKISNTI